MKAMIAEWQEMIYSVMFETELNRGLRNFNLFGITTVFYLN
jgi:hypothetical protein